MKNIATLFRHDLRTATRNVIALIVLFGVVIIPSFFAWFNVLSSWDPFSNVKDLKVAVANADKGYRSELFPMKINIGESVISNLRANTDLNWVFVSEEEAIAGTESEEFYAALVLPPNFSRDMMTFFAPGAKPTEIEYYSNEKANALSPKITGEAATEVTTKINDAFTKTLNEVGLSVVSSLATHLDDPGTQAALGRLEGSIDLLASDLHSASQTADMFSTLIASSEPLVESAASLTMASVDALQETSGAISSGAEAVQSLKSTLDTATSSLGSAFASSAGSYEALGKRVDELYASFDKQSDSVSGALKTLASEVNDQITSYQQLRNELKARADATDDPILHDALELVVSRLDGVIARQEALSDRLAEAATRIAKGDSDSEASRSEILALVNEAKTAIEGAKTSYTDSLKPKLDELGATLSSINSGFAAIGNDMTNAATTLTEGSGSLLRALAIAQESTDTMAKDLESTADNFDKLAAALSTALNTGDLSEVTEIIGSNPDILAGELATPVGLKRIPVFPVSTFGAQMAPLYTVLGLWVGALLLSVLIRVEVLKGAVQFPKPLKLPEEYFGRYAFFALLGFLQSTILYVGLIAFVGVQPVHPFLLILAGWVMSTVFSMITYTLVLSFGEAGKALAVILLIVQISAGGGAYPLSVLPQWFQNISPFIPVSHATNAVRAAIAGIYEGDYWINLGGLALFIVPTLLLGLALRVPLIKLNKDLDDALASTKLM
ncbi:MAG: YhgE/Pip family protein [Leucobacter sp.]